MRTAIFNHPFTDFYTSTKRLNPGILEYLGCIINPHEYICFDVIKNYKKQIPLPDSLKYLKKYMTADKTEYAFFSSYYQFGHKTNFDHKALLKFSPGAVIITSFAFCYFDGLKEFISYIKKILNVPVICGGNAPSSDPDYYIIKSGADFIIIGPAELSLKKLLDNLESREKAIDIENVYARRIKNKINLNKKYSYKPFLYINKKNSTVMLHLARGCLKSCSYCSIKLVSGKYFMKAALIDIRKEIEKIKKLDLNEKINFNIEDDNIAYDKEYLFKVIKSIKKYFKDATFSFENGIDYSLLEISTIKKLINSGVAQFNIALISADKNILRFTDRTQELELFSQEIDFIEKFDIPVIAYFISGLPFDSEKNIFNTLLYLAKKKVIIGISPFYPVPNTRIMKYVKKPLIPILAKATSFHEWHKLSTKKQITFFILSRFVNCMKKIKKSEWDNFDKKQIIIEKNKIVSLNLTRRESTMAAMRHSFKNKKIYYLNKDNELAEYKTDPKIASDFFKRITPL